MSHQRNSVYGRIFSSQDWRGWNLFTENATPLPGEYVVKFYENDQLVGFVRDPLGLMPFYYSTTNGFEYWHTLKQAALAHQNLSVNWDYIYAVLGDQYSLFDQSPYNEIKKLPPGHILLKQNGSWVSRKFFRDIDLTPNVDIRELFLSVIAERAQKYPQFCLSLSGGLDSSLLLGALKYTNSPSEAATLSFPAGEDTSEEIGLLALEDRWGKCFTRLSPPSPSTGIFDWRSGEHSMYDPTDLLNMPLLLHAKAKSLNCLWMGWGADEVFTLNSCLMSALFAHGEFREFFAAAKVRALTNASVKAVFYEVLRDFAPLYIKKALANYLKTTGDYVHPQSAQHARIVRQQRLKRNRRGLIYNELYERFVHNGSITFGVEQSHELAAPLGMDFSYPYLDTRLIGASMAMPSGFYFKNGLNKYALRSNFRDILPKEITDHSSRQNYSKWSGAIVLAQQEKIMQMFYANSRHKEQYRNVRSLFNSPFLFKNIRTILKLTYLAQFECVQKELSHGKEKEAVQETTT